jgi:hypothetical protein
MVGTHLHRNITWAELAGPLNTYFARTCYMLQQGRAVVDVAYLLNEGAPSTMAIWGAGTMPAPPKGYDYDFINADVLINRLSVGDDGRLVLPDGMSYRALVLPQSSRMRPELLQKLHDLVAGGATIVGPRPVDSPSLSGQPEADRSVAELAEALWGDLNGTSRTLSYVGKGMVVWGRPIEDVLTRLRVTKDFEWAGPLDADLAWVHRRTEDADIYYVSNLTERPVLIEARFRVANRQPEVWRPDSGEISPARYSRDGTNTVVSLDMTANETLFVVFSGESTAPTREVSPKQLTTLADVSGEWDLVFPPGLGAPERLAISTLKSWTEHESPGVKYFSGTARYSTNFDADDNWFKPGRKLLLSLGDVRDLAEVFVNAQPFGLLWKPPYQVDVTSALRPGANCIEVRVTNQWTNRILGDRLAPREQRVLNGVQGGFGRGPREPAVSGLLGPVQILAAE